MADSSPLVSQESQDVQVRKKISLEDMSKEDLIKQVKKQIVLLQKTKSKCDELNKHVAELEKEKKNDDSEALKDKEVTEKTVTENEDLKKQLLLSNELNSSLQKEKNALQEKYECINLKVETLSETCHILQEEGSTLNQQNQELLNEVKVLAEARDTSLLALKDVNEHLNTVQKEANETQCQLKVTEERERELIQRLEESNNKLEDLGKKTVSLDDYLHLEAKCLDAENECKTLRLRIEDIEVHAVKADQCEELQARLEKQLLELERTKTKIGELVSENEELKNRANALDLEVTTLNSERNENSLINQRSNETNEHDTVAGELESYRKKCEEFEHLLEEEKKVVNELRKELSTLQSKGDHYLDNERHNIDFCDQDYKQEMEKLNADMEGMQRVMEDNARRWDSEKSELLKELEDLRMTKEECIQNILQIKTDLETQRLQWKEEKEELLKDVGKVKGWEEESHQKLEQIKDVKETLMEQLTEATKTIRNLEKDLLKTHDQKQDAIEELFQVKDLQKFLEDEAKALKEECEKTKIEIKRLEADLENDFMHIRNLEKELREAEEREHASHKEADALHNHLVLVEEALQAAEQKLEANRNDFEKDMKFYRDQLEQVKSEYESTVSKLSHLETESLEIARECNELRTENVTLKGHISELNSVIQNRTDEMKTEEWEKEKCSLEEQLKGQKDTIVKLNFELLSVRETVFELRGSMDGLVEIEPHQDSETTGSPPDNKDSEEHFCSESFECGGGVTPIVKQDACSEVEELRTVNENLRLDLQKATEKLFEFQEVVETKSQMMEKMLIEMNNLVSQIDDLNSIVQEKELDLKSLGGKFTAQTSALKELEVSLNEKDSLLKSLATSESLETLQHRFAEENDKLKSEVSCLMLQKDELQEKIAVLTENLEQEKTIFAQESEKFMHQVKALTDEKVNCAISNEELRKHLDILSNEAKEAKEKSIENAEIDSMRMVIVNLEEEIKRLHQQESELRLCKEATGKGNEMVVTSEMQPSETCEELKDKLKMTEDKLTKFKVLAMKVKKEMTEVKRERDTFAKQSDDLSVQSRQHVLNFQSLQAEYDKLQDEFEAFKDTYNKLHQEMVVNVAEINQLKEQASSAKSENMRLQSLLDSGKNELKAAERVRCEAESKVIVLKTEKEAEQKKSEHIKIESNKLSQRIKHLEDELTREKEQHSLTTQKLEHKLQEAKQQSVLSLEIDDYEHSISELNKHIESKDIEISVLQDELSRQAERISNLAEQIGYLESQHEIEEERVNSLKIALTKAKEEAAEIMDRENQCQNRLASTKIELENVTAAREDLQVQLSDSVCEVACLRESMSNAKESYARAAKNFETRIKNLEEDLVRCTGELDSTRQEYEGYKVRVHNVLKQKQQPSVVNTFEQEQKQRLEKSIEQFQRKIQQISNDLQTKNIELESLQQEYENLLSRHTRLVSELQSKDENWMSKMEQLKKEHENHQAVWERQKLQLQQEIKATEGSYRKEIIDKELLHKLEISELRSKVAEKEKQLSCIRESSTAPLHSPNEDIPFDITQERQEGEGSECAEPIPSYKPLSVVTVPSPGFMSLEQLLQNSDSDNMEAVPQDVESLSANLAASHKKLDHLTELLNESEASNMRMSEQVRILKEEIRRLERNKEREEHSGNLEYLKNIILKFLLLQGSSERQRLLPVLSTILRLSPEEQAQIQASNIGIPDPNAPVSGWGNYLHRWSGLM